MAEKRGMVTYKHPSIDAEFTTLVRMAAARQGQQIGAFVVDTLRARATAVLKREEEPQEEAALPVRLDQVADLVAFKVSEAVAVATEKLAAEQARMFARIEETSRRGRWRR